MALILEAYYSKKIGLPSYSSHQFSLALKVELIDSAALQTETTRLYTVLQEAVDRSLQQVGWLPEVKNANGNGCLSGLGSKRNGEHWSCSDRQKDLIKRIITDHRLTQNDIDQLAMDRFGKSLTLLSKPEASNLIDELFEVFAHGQKDEPKPHIPDFADRGRPLEPAAQ